MSNHNDVSTGRSLRGFPITVWLGLVLLAYMAFSITANYHRLVDPWFAADGSITVPPIQIDPTAGFQAEWDLLRGKGIAPALPNPHQITPGDAQKDVTPPFTGIAYRAIPNPNYLPNQEVLTGEPEMLCLAFKVVDGNPISHEVVDTSNCLK